MPHLLQAGGKAYGANLPPRNDNSTYPQRFPQQIQHLTHKKFRSACVFYLRESTRFASFSSRQRFLGTGAVRKGSEAGVGQESSSEPEYSARVSRKALIAKVLRNHYEQRVFKGFGAGHIGSSEPAWLQRFFGTRALNHESPSGWKWIRKTSGCAARHDVRTASEHLASFPIVNSSNNCERRAPKRNEARLLDAVEPRRQRVLMHFSASMHLCANSYNGSCNRSTTCSEVYQIKM